MTCVLVASPVFLELLQPPVSDFKFILLYVTSLCLIPNIILYLQSISAQDEKLSKTMFLPLAERMVEKMVKEDKIEAEAEVRTSYSVCNVTFPVSEALTFEVPPVESDDSCV